MISWFLLCLVVTASKRNYVSGNDNAGGLLNGSVAYGETNRNLIKSLITIAKAEYNLRIFLHVQYESESKEIKYYLYDLANVVMMELFAESIDILFQNVMYFRNYNHFNLIFVDSVESLRNIYRPLSTHGTRNLSRTVVFLSQVRNATDPATDNRVTEALHLLWRLHVLNVGIVLHSLRNEIIMVTYFPFGMHGCRILQPSIINHYDISRQRWASSEYFPSKLGNFHGCNLTVVTRERMPYFKIKGNGQLEGLEGRLMEFMAFNLNFTIDMQLMSPSQRSEAEHNIDKVLAEFDEVRGISDGVDLAIGAFYLQSDNGTRTSSFAQSNYYFLSHIQVVVNVMHSDFSTYEKLAYPFRSFVWLLIGLTLALGWSVILTSERLKKGRFRAFLLGSRNTTPYYNMFTVGLGATSSVALPQRNFARFLLIVWLMLSMVMRNAYQSGMYQMLRDNSRRDLPQTLQAVFERNYFVAVTSQKIQTFLNPSNSKLMHYLNITEMQAFNAMAMAKRRQALITAYENFGHFRRVSALSHRLGIIKERIFSQPLVIYVRRNSFLMNVLNEQIVKSQKFGFIQIWKRPYIDERAQLSPNVDDTNDSDDELSNGKSILSMRELEPIFMILLWSHILAIGVFAVELLWAKRARASKMLMKY